VEVEEQLPKLNLLLYLMYLLLKRLLAIEYQRLQIGGRAVTFTAATKAKRVSRIRSHLILQIRLSITTLLVQRTSSGGIKSYLAASLPSISLRRILL
jgi:hypothetical protein